MRRCCLLRHSLLCFFACFHSFSPPWRGLFLQTYSFPRFAAAAWRINTSSGPSEEGGLCNSRRAPFARYCSGGEGSDEVPFVVVASTSSDEGGDEGGAGGDEARPSSLLNELPATSSLLRVRVATKPSTRSRVYRLPLYGLTRPPRRKNRFGAFGIPYVRALRATPRSKRLFVSG